MVAQITYLSVVRPARLAVAACIASTLLAALPAAAQGPATLNVKVRDAEAGSPVVDGSLYLRQIEPKNMRPEARQAATNANGECRFQDLPRGRYKLTVERFGYRRVELEVELNRDEPLSISVLIEPVPIPLDAMSPGRARLMSPSLVEPEARHTIPASAGRAGAIRFRQQRFLSSDARQLSYADLHESNTLMEDDVFRALQRLPGVGTRDEYSTDLWTRGAPASQTTVLFDGVPLIGSYHALGVLGGLNTDVLATATFQPGVASASAQGGGAGGLEVETRSGTGEREAGIVTISPVSARFVFADAVSDRVGLTFGARRSLVDLLAVHPGLVPSGQRVPYAFADVTARADLILSDRYRVESSLFWQTDRIFGDVTDVAYGNDGRWGASVARASIIAELSSAILRTTVGISRFDASLQTSRLASPDHPPLHPTTENHYRTVLWEGRAESRPESETLWSIGIRATREDHDYSGPDIDLARLLSPDELQRRGIGDLTPIIARISRAHLLKSQSMTRLALWGERRQRISDRLEAAGGIRIETGEAVHGSTVRLAPRIHVRYTQPGWPISLTAAFGRAFQYLQSTARTDVVRSGLRASELLAQADENTRALRSDVFTIGTELWGGPAWLVGATAWLRLSNGILIPEPTPGVIDAPRASVDASGTAHGLELSARKLEGRTRGFASYTLGWSRLRTGARAFDASEDRRHVANIGLVMDVIRPWNVGATLRAESGAPYTRITLVDTGCEDGISCGDPPSVLYGTPGGQQAPAFANLDLSTEWTFTFAKWSLTAWGQLRNALGSANAVTYHSSCICITGEAAASADLRDRFDRGLPRLPILGLRARF